MEKVKELNIDKSSDASSDNSNLPEKKFRSGAISATIWANQSVSKEGKAYEYKSVTFERSFKDKDDKWHTTNNLRMNDLPKATLVLQKAYEHLAMICGEN
ncbi:hypothetical protein JW868_01345 [Candidatus Woesearchaeota archaeon]|nr:hypothetical protein [Candidatus Woesearchaeota archaeon]